MATAELAEPTGEERDALETLLCTRQNPVEMSGIEPPTPSLRTRCSSQLSYIPGCGPE
jgi:hypothetical protein